MSGVSLNPSTLTLDVGKSETLTVTVAPADAENKAVTWAVTGDAATVSDAGVVTAVKAGTATITVTTKDGGKTAACTVTVNAAAVSVTEVTLNKSTLALTVGGSETLTATVAPGEATDKSVTWKSDKTDIATVVEGKVTAVKAGTATITVTTNDGGKTATCDVTVTPDEDIDNVLDKITDANFKAALTTLMTDNGWDANTDGKLSPAEAATVIGMMDVSGEGIASLAGIEYFTALTQLSCYNNYLDALNLSANTALESLYCSSNALTTLDVSKNTALTYLSCGNWSTELTVTVDAAAHDISTNGNLVVYAPDGSGGYPRITALNTPVNGVTVTAGDPGNGDNFTPGGGSGW